MIFLIINRVFFARARIFILPLYFYEESRFVLLIRRTKDITRVVCLANLLANVLTNQTKQHRKMHNLKPTRTKRKQLNTVKTTTYKNPDLVASYDIRTGNEVAPTYSTNSGLQGRPSYGSHDTTFPLSFPIQTPSATLPK